MNGGQYDVDGKIATSRAMGFALAAERALRQKRTIYVRPTDGSKPLGYAEWVDDHVEVTSNGEES